jgi:hypothetical protein
VSINATLSGPMPDYWERAASLPYEKVKLLEPQQSPTRHLSVVERATLKCVAPSLPDVPSGNSVLHEVATRLSAYRRRGALEYMSGQHIADLLQYLYWPEHPSRNSRRGWTLLHALDEANLGVEVWISAEPLERHGGFRRMRLHERLAELQTRGIPHGRQRDKPERTATR